VSGDSKPVESNQEGIHPDLEWAVRRHLAHEYLKPQAPHTLEAFQLATAWIAGRDLPLILDSGCGVGESSCKIALENSDCLVIGIDKSAMRLSKNQGVSALPPNLLLLRADVVDFWILAVCAQWKLQHHFLLYPNPWPKSRHFMRRWHAHPIFPTLLALGGKLELRTNWKTYAQEFAQSLFWADVKNPICTEFEPLDPLTPFERKYLASSHRLWKVEANLRPV
jgi:tRNA G46 methylase TrmB